MACYQGSCHCGRVAYEVEADLGQTITCNCSYCQRRGSVLAFTPAQNFTLTKGEDALTEYRFNTQKIQHLFCESCGIESFARGETPDGSQMVAINARCLAGVEPAELNSTAYDGRSR
ncbi:GFA family protein [Bosea rubneri]|uniref:GFA family protein n=1 Tax=Bosea rubneri TaxID=3075434 RepID=A0ABU3S892_9HYPH|nr:GFA family protein [Bosea sp. ZW T0_25]MDU0340602.1 GFA family protein [Bosea sp. ZW T0_25]